MDVQKLYQELVLRWNADRRFVGDLPAATHRAIGNNPLCGDKVSIALQVERDLIQAAKFTGEMSAITTASAAILCQQVIGLSVAQARSVSDDALSLVQGGMVMQPALLGDFSAFELIRRYPNRVKTATLPWAALQAALASPINSTEALTEITTENVP